MHRGRHVSRLNACVLCCRIFIALAHQKNGTCPKQPAYGCAGLEVAECRSDLQRCVDCRSHLHQYDASVVLEVSQQTAYPLIQRGRIWAEAAQKSLPPLQMAARATAAPLDHGIASAQRPQYRLVR